MQFSAVLVNWKRPHNLPVIFDSLLAVPRIKEILVWDNSCRLTADTDPRIRIFGSSENVCTLGRFKAVAHAQCEAIYTQDDDYRIEDIDEILDGYEQKPEHITASLTQGHMATEAGKKPWVQLGWGSAFSALSADVLQYYTDVYGEDDVLRRKADRIFTILHGKHRYRPAKAKPLVDQDGRKSESSKDALYKRPDHYALTVKASQRALEILGAAKQ